SSPLTSDIRRIKKAEDCGAAAVCIKHSMAEQPFRGTPRFFVDPKLGIIVHSDRRLDIDEGERMVSEAKEKSNLVVIANMSGPHAVLDGWGEIARKMEAAGADMIELNMNCPNLGLVDRSFSQVAAKVMAGASVGQDPEVASAVTRVVKSAVKVPVICKFTSEGGRMVEVARACADAGADAVQIHATFVATPHVDIYNDGRPVTAGLKGRANISGLTGRWSRLVSNRFVAQVSRTVSIPVIGSGGIEQWDHVVESMMFGSSAVQMCSSLIINGFEIMPRMLEKLESYLERQGHQDLSSIRGAALKHLVTAPQLEFDPVVSAVDEALCNGCGKCAKVGSCNAIEMVNKKAVVNPAECVGCNVCRFICPTRAISMQSPVPAV
ncbi:MAG: tRNA-dihydrouridine synthase, partial [Chloroflexi bacterium]|nr:tRNA-dihydrouridine synthase [Chloroflexota bacterium]